MVAKFYKSENSNKTDDCADLYIHQPRGSPTISFVISLSFGKCNNQRKDPNKTSILLVYTSRTQFFSLF